MMVWMVHTGRLRVGSLERWLARLCETRRWYYVYLAPFRTINGSDTAEIRNSFILLKLRIAGLGGWGGKVGEFLSTAIIKFCLKLHKNGYQQYFTIVTVLFYIN
jgi:hypothetical protein